MAVDFAAKKHSSIFNKINLVFAIFLLALLGIGAGWAQADVSAYPQAVFVPLDDRPSTKMFPTQIARIGGGTLLVPGKTELGNATTPGDCQALANWLKKQAAGTPREYIISSDMLVYGGLWTSRTAGLSQEQALERLQVLREIRPHATKITVYSTLPRLALATSQEETQYQQALSNWAAKASYANLKYHAKVPEKISEEYMSVRRRNVQVVLSLIDLVQEGVIDNLVIGQDDSCKTGLNIEEQQQVHERINKANLQSSVTVLNGADELGMCLVAGWLSRYWNCHPALQVFYTDPEAATQVPAMESRPLDETVSRHIDICGAVNAASTNTAPVRNAALLWLATQSDKPYAGSKSTESSDSQQERARELKTALAWCKSNHRIVGVADTRLINQADPILAAQVLEASDLWDIAGYAAWNTPSNTIGTIISQMTVFEIARQRGAKWNQTQKVESAKTQIAFTWARLIDDYAYQAMIRPALSQEAKSLPRNPDPLLNVYGGVGMNARQGTIAWAEDVWKNKLQGKCFTYPNLGTPLCFDSYKLEVTLPWQRVFEIEARLDVRLHLMTSSEAKAYYAKQATVQKAPVAKNTEAAGKDGAPKASTTGKVDAPKASTTGKVDAPKASTTGAKTAGKTASIKKTVGKAPVGTTKDKATEFVNDPTKAATDAYNKTKNKATKYVNDPGKATSEAIDDTEKAVKDFIPKAKKTINSIWNEITGK